MRRHYRLLVVSLLIPLFILLTFNAVYSAGDVSLTSLGVPYTENLNTLAISGTSSSVPIGWDFSEALANANITYTAGTGSSTTGDTYSFGSASSSERAFGGLQSGSLRTTIGTQFVNNTGSTINYLRIQYTGELWRLGATGRQDRLDFQYSTNATSLTTGTWTDVNALDFSTPNTTAPTGARDGNLPANRTQINATVGGLSIPNGDRFWIRWTDLDIAGAEDGLAIDDFSLIPESNPAVVSILRVNPSPTNSQSVIYSVTFNKTVTGVDSADFSVFSSGLSGAAVTSVNGSGLNYSVAVDTGSGSGSLRLDLLDDDSIIDAQSVPLGGSGTGNGAYSAGEEYTIDRQPPAVQTVTRVNSNPTNQPVVSFNIVFSKTVTGVDTGDFSIFATGISGASAVGISGSGMNYTLMVNTGTGSGTLRLDVIDNDSIIDGLGNPLGGPGNDNGSFSAGESYDIDRSASSTDAGIIINEISNGSTGIREWIEMVVVGENPVDLSGWILDDNNGDFDSFAVGKGIASGHLRFNPIIPVCGSGVPLSSAPVGSRIVIYNSADAEGALSTIPNDPCDTDADGVYYLPVGPTHNTVVLQQCADFPRHPDRMGYIGCAYTSPALTWNGMLLANTGDAIQARKPNSIFYHGFAYGNLTVPSAPIFPNGANSFNVNTASGTQSAYQFHCGDYFSNNASQFARITASSALPGRANSMNNAVFIRSLQQGTFNINAPADIENCRIEPEVLLSFSQNQIRAGEPVGLNISLANRYNTMDGYTLDLLGVESTVTLPAGMTLVSAVPDSNSCGGSINAVAGGTSIGLSGITLNGQVEPLPSTCNITFNVTANAAGEYRVDLDAGSVLSAALGVSGGANLLPVSANLTVVDPDRPNVLPQTGFTPGRISQIPVQPVEKAYSTDTGLFIEIPKLNVKIPIVGVPLSEEGWDVTWLGRNAGWLESTVFPTWAGNSVVTAHVWDALNQAGPFANLDDLTWGDQIHIFFDGIRYTYEVREQVMVKEDEMDLVFKHEEHPWLTLLTCKNYSEKDKVYTDRMVIRAVMVGKQ
jgi:LPXTG-site transpeptidase (sortase) family protein